jgi:hypothetical protein
MDSRAVDEVGYSADEEDDGVGDVGQIGEATSRSLLYDTPTRQLEIIAGRLQL